MLSILSAPGTPGKLMVLEGKLVLHKPPLLQA
jgi:hypothetical protein